MSIDYKARHHKKFKQREKNAIKIVDKLINTPTKFLKRLYITLYIQYGRHEKSAKFSKQKSNLNGQRAGMIKANFATL